MLRKSFAAVAAIAMLAGSSAAVAQSAQSLSLAGSPAGAPTTGANQLDDRNGIGIYLIGAVVLGLIIWGVIELTKDDEGSDSP